MKGIIKAIDRFCYKHPRFGIPNLMMCVIAGNVVAYLLSMMGDTGGVFLSYLFFDANLIMRGEVWRLITFVFIPMENNLFLFALYLYFYYFIGTTLERQWGTGKFTIYYLTGVIFLIIFGFACKFLLPTNTITLLLANLSLSSYYLNLSMFFVFATFYPEMRVLFMFFIPVKMKWLAILDLVFFIVAIIRDPFPVNLLPVVCLLHYFVFCGGWLIDYLRSAYARSKQGKNTVNFRQEAERIRKQENQKVHLRRCEVCGKTDTDYPDMEFRYCSRCEGYHCYCEEHIGNHEHFR